MELMEVNGKEIKFYSIGEFASTVDRDAQTIRKWEWKGVIPPTVFKRRTGVRIYPEGIVLGVKKLCRKHHLQQGKPIPDAFVQDVAQMWKKETAEILSKKES